MAANWRSKPLNVSRETKYINVRTYASGYRLQTEHSNKSGYLDGKVRFGPGIMF
jgi:hypothetical protein